MTGLSTQGYSIPPAQAEHIPALSAIELAAAQPLKGYAPESMLAETTEEGRFVTAARNGRLRVASTGDTLVASGWSRCWPTICPISKKLTSTLLMSVAGRARLWSGQSANGRQTPGMPCCHSRRSGLCYGTTRFTRVWGLWSLRDLEPRIGRHRSRRNGSRART